MAKLSEYKDKPNYKQLNSKDYDNEFFKSERR